VGLTVLATPLTYLSCAAGPAKVFIWFANIATLVAMSSWLAICVTYLRFYAALKSQGVDRDQLPFKSPFQPYLAWGTIVYFSVLTLFNGFYSFTPWKVETFITTYIGIPIFFGLFLFWKLFKQTKWVNPAEADLWTGKAAIDAELWPVSTPQNIAEKVSSSFHDATQLKFIVLCLTYALALGLDCLILAGVPGNNQHGFYLPIIPIRYLDMAI
jgi:amino acid transporter